jgi:hypothetical protein
MSEHDHILNLKFAAVHFAVTFKWMDAGLDLVRDSWSS